MAADIKSYIRMKGRLKKPNKDNNLEPEGDEKQSLHSRIMTNQRGVTFSKRNPISLDVAALDIHNAPFVLGPHERNNSRWRPAHLNGW